MRAKYNMESFKEYLEEQEFIESVITEFNQAPTATHQKPWSAKKKDVMNTWKMLRPETPIYMTPMSQSDASNMKTYGEDGIRVTGSYVFITSVMAKLKELLAYENPQNKLRIVFRGVDKTHGGVGGKKSFVFYVNLENRGGSKQPHIGA